MIIFKLFITIVFFKYWGTSLELNGDNEIFSNLVLN